MNLVFDANTGFRVEGLGLRDPRQVLTDNIYVTSSTPDPDPTNLNPKKAKASRHD